MKQSYVVGVDIGTTGTKAIVLDTQGHILGSGYREYTCTYPKPSWVEQDVEMLIGSSMDAVREALAASNVEPGSIAGLAFSSQRCCTLLVDEAGNLVRPMISWQDNRSSAQLEQIRGGIPPEEYYDIMRMPMSTTWMISKILWLIQNEPDNWARAWKVIQLQDYTLRAWGAEQYLNDLSDAGFYGFWNLERFDWDERLSALIGITPEKLPRPTASGEPAGRVSAAAAQRSGLLEGTPLFVGAGDQNCAALGAGVVEPGDVCLSLGTAGALIAFLDKPYRDPSGTAVITNHPIRGCWELEGYQAGAAGIYRWFRDEIAAEECLVAKQRGVDVYQVLDEQIAQVPVGAKGLVMLPFFATATTPRWNSDARGTLCGLTLAHDRACLARAFMEGVTFGAKDMLEVLGPAGMTPHSVSILGGPTRSELWNQMQADIYDCTVQTLCNTDAAVLGAAIIAGFGAGLYTDLRDGARQVVRVDKVYTPDADSATRYRELYDIHNRMYDGLVGQRVFESIARFQEK